MSEQRSLFAPDPVAQLTDRQRHAYQLVCSSLGGVEADTVGAAWHAHRGKHAASDRCDWCHQEGVSVLRSKALRPLVIRRKSGRWQPRNPADATAEPSPQMRDLPGETWEDAFGGEAA